MFGLKAKLIGLGVMVLIMGVLAWQVKYWHGAYVVAKAAFEVSESQHKVTTASFKSYRENAENDLAKLRTVSGELNTDYDKARKYINKLEETLSRHDFGMLTKRKPGLIERRVNRATGRVLNELKGVTSDFSRGEATPGGEAP